MYIFVVETLIEELQYIVSSYYGNIAYIYCQLHVRDYVAIEVCIESIIILGAAYNLENTLHIFYTYTVFAGSLQGGYLYMFCIDYCRECLTPGQLPVNSQTFTLHLYML